MEERTACSINKISKFVLMIYAFTHIFDAHPNPHNISKKNNETRTNPV